MKNQEVPVEVNGRTYRWPSDPVVVVCIDGCSPAYLEWGLAAGPFYTPKPQAGSKKIYGLAEKVTLGRNSGPG